MLLRYSLGLETEAKAVEDAVDAALIAGACTADIARMTGKPVSTGEFKETVMSYL